MCSQGSFSISLLPNLNRQKEFLNSIGSNLGFIKVVYYRGSSVHSYFDSFTFVQSMVFTQWVHLKAFWPLISWRTYEGKGHQKKLKKKVQVPFPKSRQLSQSYEKKKSSLRAKLKFIASRIRKTIFKTQHERFRIQFCTIVL